MSDIAAKVKAAQAARAKAAAAKGRGAEDEEEPSSPGMSPLTKKLFVGAVLCVMAVIPAMQLYLFLFPNYPARLPTKDAATVQRIFFGGEPALVLCENSTSIDAAGPAAVALASRLGVPAYRLDCSLPLPGSERNTFERLSLERWNPTAFLVANGRKRGEQLPPHFTDAAQQVKLAKGLALRIKARHTRVDNTHDLTQCVDNSAEACVLVYSSKGKEEGAAELAPLVAAHRAHTFATLNAAARAFRAPSVPLVEGLLKEEVAVAKAAVGGAEGGGGKPSVLIGLRRVPSALAGGGSGNILVTFKAAAGSYVALSDAGALLAGQRAATDALRALADAAAARVKAGELASDVAVEASFERDEKLQALGAVLLSSGDLLIDRAAVKATPTPAAAAAEEAAAAAAAAAGEAAAGEEAVRAREAEARRRMAEEEASSLAQLVDEDEAAAAEGSGAGAGGDEAESGGVDLDEL
jgi:hypothetical protein